MFRDRERIRGPGYQMIMMNNPAFPEVKGMVLYGYRI